MMKTAFAFVALLTAGLAGCGGPEITNIQGSVLVEGSPISKVAVCFWPNDEPQFGMLVCEEIEPDSTFKIVPAPEFGQKGFAGSYKVLIGESQPSILIPPRFARKYVQFKTTPLEVELTKGVNMLDPFDLETNADELKRWQSIFSRMGTSRR